VVKVVQETRRDHQILYFCLYYYHWVDTSAGGLLFPEGIIRHVGSALVVRNTCLSIVSFFIASFGKTLNIPYRSNQKDRKYNVQTKNVKKTNNGQIQKK
jgi:hypothetical protein